MLTALTIVAMVSAGFVVPSERAHERSGLAECVAGSYVAIDPDGNLTNIQTSGGWATAYRYDLADQLLDYQQTAGGTPGDKVELDYDPRGNVARIRLYANGGTQVTSERVLTWDSQGRLTGVTRNQSEVFSGGYLDDYRLFYEVTPDGSMVNNWSFGNVLFERDGVTYTPYVMNLSVFGLDDHLARGPPDGNKEIVVGDHQGTVQSTVDGFGTVLRATEYEPYGSVRGGDAPGKIGFHGARFYEESGLYYLRNRWYSPELKRFVSRDPIGFAGGFNLYAYANGNPANLKDPTGNLAFLIPILASVAFEAAYENIVNNRNPSATQIAKSIMLGAVSGPLGAAAAVSETLLRKISTLLAGAIAQAIAGGLFDKFVEGCPPETLTSLFMKNFLEATLGEAFGFGIGQAFKSAASRLGSWLSRRFGGAADEALEAVARALCKLASASFAAGTPVETAEGLVPIEEVQVGDWVKSRSQRTGRVAFRRVVQLFETHDQEILEVAIRKEGGVEEMLEVTPNHQIWIGGQGWTEAKDVRPGDEVLGSTGSWLRVSGLRVEKERTSVYNLDVEEFDSYFVGKLGVWAHNTSGCRGVRGAPGPGGGGHGESLLALPPGRTENPLSRPLFGHSYSRHGPKRSVQSLIDRARATGNPQGQWLDEHGIVEAATTFPGRITVHDVPIAHGRGRVIMPDGTIVPATRARVVLNTRTGGVRVTYPIPD